MKAKPGPQLVAHPYGHMEDEGPLSIASARPMATPCASKCIHPTASKQMRDELATTRAHSILRGSAFFSLVLLHVCNYPAGDDLGDWNGYSGQDNSRCISHRGHRRTQEERRCRCSVHTPVGFLRSLCASACRHHPHNDQTGNIHQESHAVLRLRRHAPPSPAHADIGAGCCCWTSRQRHGFVATEAAEPRNKDALTTRWPPRIRERSCAAVRCPLREAHPAPGNFDGRPAGASRGTALRCVLRCAMSETAPKHRAGAGQRGEATAHPARSSPPTPAASDHAPSPEGCSDDFNAEALCGTTSSTRRATRHCWRSIPVRTPDPRCSTSWGLAASAFWARPAPRCTGVHQRPGLQRQPPCPYHSDQTCPLSAILSDFTQEDSRTELRRLRARSKTGGQAFLHDRSSPGTWRILALDSNTPASSAGGSPR